MDQNAEKTIHTLKSSNLPFYIAIWETAKASEGLVVFSKRFYWDERPSEDSRPAPGKRFALVDIVSHDGEEWIKVSTIAEHRLIFELSKAQWELAESEGSDDETDGQRVSSPVLETILDRIELVQTVDSLAQASRAHRVRYKHPRVRVVLPKISNPPPVELLPLLDRIRSTGAVIDLGAQSVLPNQPGQSPVSIFPKLLPSLHPPLTSTLNIDCTILLAIVSDLSHIAHHPIMPTYNGAIRRQIEIETTQHLVPATLWPAMADRDLVCTGEAAHRMKEIVDTIGTSAERARTKLLFRSAEQGIDQLSGQERRAQFAKYSDHCVPDSLRLPISVVPAVGATEVQAFIADRTLPPVADQVNNKLTEINRSVFMYGWVKGLSTVTSNRAAVKWIESMIENEGTDAVGPSVWLREPARSLLGKEMERKK